MKQIVFGIFFLTRLFLGLIFNNLTISRLWLIFLVGNMSTEIHVAFYGTPWYDQVWVTLRIDCRYIIVSCTVLGPVLPSPDT